MNVVPSGVRLEEGDEMNQEIVKKLQDMGWGSDKDDWGMTRPLEFGSRMRVDSTRMLIMEGMT